MGHAARRRQDDLQVVDDPHAPRHVDAGRRRVPVLLDLEPGRLAVQIAVGLAGQPHGFAQGSPELAGVVQPAHRFKPGLPLASKARSSSSSGPGSGTTPSKRS